MTERDLALRHEALTSLARRIRRHVLVMTHLAGASHVASGLSVADILSVLYGDVLRVDPLRPDWPGRDRLVFSKGHAGAALYAVLAERGYFPVSELETFYKDGSRLLGHASHGSVPGVECLTGSLGHGLSIACGMALASRHDGGGRVFALLSDAECDEGSTWEAALFAPHHRLENLTVIIDYNKMQSLGRTTEILSLEPLAAKWRAFGWAASEVDGHSVEALRSTLSGVPIEPGRPTCVVAHTIKGKGVAFMEDQLVWHYRAPNAAELERALAEIGSDPA